MESLESRVETLSSAVDDMTATFINYSDVMLAAQRSKGDLRGIQTTKQYLERFLSAARRAIEASSQADVEGDLPAQIQGADELLANVTAQAAAVWRSAEGSSRDQSHAAGAEQFDSSGSSIVPSRAYSESSYTNPVSLPPIILETSGDLDQPSPAKFSPRLNYGLLHWDPFHTGNAGGPDNMPMFLSPSRGGLALQLFWTSLTTALRALKSLESSYEGNSLAMAMFGYSLRHESLEWMVHRISRRLQLMPPYDPATWPQESAIYEFVGNTYIDSSDPEWDRIKRLRQAISRDLVADGSSPTDFIDAWAVENRLSSFWGLDTRMPRAMPRDENSYINPQILGGSGSGGGFGGRINESRLANVDMAESSRSSSVVSASRSQPQHRSAASLGNQHAQASPALPQPPRSPQLPGEGPTSRPEHPGFPPHFSTRVPPGVLDDIIQRLANVSICLGTGPAYPIAAVDRIAQSTLVGAAA